MNNETLINIVTGIVLILGSLTVVCFMIGVFLMAFNWALHRVVDVFWGVKNVCEYLIDKRQREREQRRAEKTKAAMQKIKEAVQDAIKSD